MLSTTPQHLAMWKCGKIKTNSNFCQISLLWKVSKSSKRLGTFQISIYIVTNSRNGLNQKMQKFHKLSWQNRLFVDSQSFFLNIIYLKSLIKLHFLEKNSKRGAFLCKNISFLFALLFLKVCKIVVKNVKVIGSLFSLGEALSNIIAIL